MEPLAQLTTVLDLLQKLAREGKFGCLSLKIGSVEWEIALRGDCQLFAAHSLDPVEKIDRHLRRLGFHNPAVTGIVRDQVKGNLAKNLKTLSRVEAELIALQELLNQGFICSSEAQELASELTIESLETILGCSSFEHHLLCVELDCPAFQWPILEQISASCQERILAWQALTSQITSPHQRPQLTASTDQLSSEQHQRLSKLLVGFSFRQLSIVLNQDELKIAQSLQPLIQKGTIKLLPPHSPFDQLPNLRPVASPQASHATAGQEVYQLQSSIANRQDAQNSVKRIVCVDDSPTLLRIVQQYLGDNKIEIYPIIDSLQALREIIRLKPDLILLDVGMPGLDGYKLCSLVRNHSLFKVTPIIMVTGNTGFLDRARARSVGATDYLTKPFTQTDLRATVSQYLELSSHGIDQVSAAT